MYLATASHLVYLSFSETISFILISLSCMWCVCVCVCVCTHTCTCIENTQAEVREQLIDISLPSAVWVLDWPQVFRLWVGAFTCWAISLVHELKFFFNLRKMGTGNLTCVSGGKDSTQAKPSVCDTLDHIFFIGYHWLILAWDDQGSVSPPLNISQQFLHFILFYVCVFTFTCLCAYVV